MLEGIAETLSRVGLSPGEAKVYLSLLEHGPSTTGPLATRAGVSSGKVYLILGRLMRKGLVSYVVRDKVRSYSAENPDFLGSLLREREEQIHDVKRELAASIPRLQALKRPVHYNAQMYFGIDGIRNAALNALRELKPGGEVLALGVTSKKHEALNRFWRKWNASRVKRRANARMLFTEDDEFYRSYRDFPRTKARVIHNIYPATIDVVGNHVLLLTYGDNPSCIDVTSPDIAASFTNFFDSLWKIAKP